MKEFKVLLKFDALSNPSLKYYDCNKKFLILMCMNEHNVEMGDLHIYISFKRKEVKINDLFK